MISVVIPTLDAAARLPATLSALVPAVVEGVVREVIVADGGSSDATAEIADLAGATVLRCATGRGIQLMQGARAARADWLLFLHADTVLATDWQREASAFITRMEAGDRPLSAACFRFALDDFGLRPRMLEALVRLRCTALGLPYGDQALLIPRVLYERVGGYRPLPLMEDVDLVRRLGRRRLTVLRSTAVTSAERYKRDGYFRRAARNLICLSLYFLRVPPRMLARLYA
jgi:rSAM/selenodomain-associated transferase 2